ncbi:Hypothetical predicted protein, partial [Mytilus galloprovincialis]
MVIAGTFNEKRKYVHYQLKEGTKIINSKNKYVKWSERVSFESTVEEMNIVDEDDVEVERFKEYDSSLTDHHRGLFEEVNIPNRRRYLKWCIPIVVFLILGIAAVVIAADLGLFSSKTTPTTQEITGDKTDRGTSCLLHDMSDKNVDPFIDTCKF